MINSRKLKTPEDFLIAINQLDKEATDVYEDKFRIEHFLSRSLVSFQANKNRPFYRWYKFKEAFSADMVEFFIDEYSIQDVSVFDPFAGSGTTLFTASERGLSSEGIELLPIGHHIVKARRILSQKLSDDSIAIMKKWREEKPWNNVKHKSDFVELRITRGGIS